ncbi:uncharacterized protein LOC143286307 [Babylonia areolata]|uniref:uncharacterized protein LOC143286307 n=1 Tax=Babylonia areolata TaxID=304850 RepID=UPI003FD389F9
MGCGGSKKSEGRHSSLGEKQVVVHVGENVKPVDGGPVLVFVFGGPGSRKGRLVSELVETYGFTFINVEKLLLNHLLKKVPENDRVGASFDPQDVIKEEPELVSLHWLLGEVSRQMEQCGQGASRFIVDIMPNLKFLINSDVFLAACTADMKNFEQKHPIAFALNFIQRSAKKSKKEAEPAKEKEEKANMYSDEADSSRTRRRITLFDNNVRPFIDYFSQSERLISLDVTGVQVDVVWGRLCDLFAGLHIDSLSHVNYILVFVFDSEELEQVSSDQADMQVVQLRSLVDGPDTSLVDCVAALCKHLDKSDPSLRTFVINVEETCLGASQQNEQQTNGHSIVFIDEDVSQLPKFVPLNKAKAGARTVKFRAVSSTENRVCLFPCHVPLTTCKEIALVLGNHLLHR